MSRNIKIMITIIITLGILLILPKNEKAQEYTFNCHDSRFTLNASTNSIFALAHNLLNSDSVEAFNNNYSDNWKARRSNFRKCNSL